MSIIPGAPPRAPIRMLVLAVLGGLNVLIWGLQTGWKASAFHVALLILWLVFTGFALFRWRRDVSQFRATHP